MNVIHAKPVIYPRNNGTYDATVFLEVLDWTTGYREIVHKYVRVGFHSRKDAENYAYNESLHVQSVMFDAAKAYMSKYKDAQ